MKNCMLAVALLLSMAGAASGSDSCDPVVSTPIVDVCPPPAPVCAPASAGGAVSGDPEVYYEVPVTKKVRMQEVYTVNERRTKVEMEVRTKVVKPNAPRLVRTARGGRAVKVHRDLPREKTYLKPVKTVYEVPVSKTRDIVVDVEEMTLVPAGRMRAR